VAANTQPVSTFSSREFAHDLGRVKRAAQEGPVFITDRGRPTFALLTIEEYRRMASGGTPGRTLLEVMNSLPDTAGIDFEPVRLQGVVRGADLE